MIYSIYIPGKQGGNKAHLAEVGIAELFPPNDSDAMCTDIVQGPDGRQGQIWTWGQGANIAAYQPDRQKWEPCQPDPRANLSAGRFWWGLIGTPSEQDLRRKVCLPWNVDLATLADQQWRIPNVLGLPETFGFDETGDIVKQPAAEFRSFVEDCEWVMPQLLKEDEPGPDDWKRQFEVAVRFLSLNYRVNRELVVKLGILTPANMVEVNQRAVDFRRLIELANKLKNQTAGAQGPSGSSVSDGQEGLIPVTR